MKNALRWLVVLASLLVLALWLQFAPPGLWGKADAIGYAVCHQIEARSFHLGERALPLCARCSGMYLGAMLGLAYQAWVSPRHERFPGWRQAWPFLLVFLAFAVDGSNSYLYLLKTRLQARISLPNLYTPNNTLRLFTGSGMGLAAAAFLYPAFNQVFWRTPRPQPALNGRQVTFLFGLTFLADLLILSERPFILWPLAVISTLGVLVMLTMIYAAAWTMVFRQENTYASLRAAWLPLLAGLTLALLQIYALDALRLWLTGTWDSFIL